MKRLDRSNDLFSFFFFFNLWYSVFSLVSLLSDILSLSLSLAIFNSISSSISSRRKVLSNERTDIFRKFGGFGIAGNTITACRSGIIPTSMVSICNDIKLHSPVLNSLVTCVAGKENCPVGGLTFLLSDPFARGWRENEEELAFFTSGRQASYASYEIGFHVKLKSSRVDPSKKLQSSRLRRKLKIGNLRLCEGQISTLFRAKYKTIQFRDLLIF